MNSETCVIVNTSCEHIEAFSDWFDSPPSGPLLVLQSNDYFSCDEHINCVNMLDEFNPSLRVLVSKRSKMG